MPCCSIINCSNTTNKGAEVNRGISFHRFPTDPHVKNKWIEATGRKKWFPTKNSRICSIHFYEDTFTGPSRYRRVTSTAIPTIDVVLISNDEKVTGSQSASAQVNDKTDEPSERITEDEHDSDSGDSYTVRIESAVNVAKEHPTDDSIETNSQESPQIRELKVSLSRANNIIKHKTLEVKRVKEKNRRLTKKVAKMADIIQSLRRQLLEAPATVKSEMSECIENVQAEYSDDSVITDPLETAEIGM